MKMLSLYLYQNPLNSLNRQLIANPAVPVEPSNGVFQNELFISDRKPRSISYNNINTTLGTYDRLPFGIIFIPPLKVFLFMNGELIPTIYTGADLTSNDIFLIVDSSLVCFSNVLS